MVRSIVAPPANQPTTTRCVVNAFAHQTLVRQHVYQQAALETANNFLALKKCCAGAPPGRKQGETRPPPCPSGQHRTLGAALRAAEARFARRTPAKQSYSDGHGRPVDRAYRRPTRASQRAPSSSHAASSMRSGQAPATWQSRNEPGL